MTIQHTVAAAAPYTPEDTEYDRIMDEYNKSLYGGDNEDDPENVFFSDSGTIYQRLYQIQLIVRGVQTVLTGFPHMLITLMRAIESSARGYSDPPGLSYQDFLARPTVDSFADCYVKFAVTNHFNNYLDVPSEDTFAEAIDTAIGTGRSHTIRKNKDGMFMLIHSPSPRTYGGFSSNHPTSTEVNEATWTFISGLLTNTLSATNQDARHQQVLAALKGIERAFASAALEYLSMLLGTPEAANPKAGAVRLRRHFQMTASTDLLLPKASAFRKLILMNPVVKEQVQRNLTFAKWVNKYWAITAYLMEDVSVLSSASYNQRWAGDSGVKPRNTEMTLADTASRIIAISYTNQIPESVVRYITQAGPDGNISISALNTWATVYTHEYFGKGDTAGIPDYIIPYKSLTKAVSSASGGVAGRKRVNQDNLLINSQGNVLWVPDTDESMLAEYQDTLDEATKIAFRIGSPFDVSRATVDDVYSLSASQEDVQRLRDLKTKLAGLACVPLGAFWGLNSVLVPNNQNPSITQAEPVNSAIPLDSRSATDMVNGQSLVELVGYLGEFEGSGDIDTINLWTRSNTLKDVLQAYEHLVLAGKATPLDQLMREAVRRTVPSVDVSGVPSSSSLDPVTDGIHDELRAFHQSISPTGGFKQGTSKGLMHLQLLSMVSEAVYREYIGDRWSANNKKDPIFGGRPPTAAQLWELDKYAAVHVLLRVMATVAEGFKSSAEVYSLVGDKTHMETMNKEGFNRLSYRRFGTAKALSVLMGKYSEPTYFSEMNKRARALTEAGSIKSSDNLQTLDEARERAPEVAGAESLNMFPHQVKGTSILGRTAREQFAIEPNAMIGAIVDVAPGGGKTIQLLSDAIGFLMRGQAKRPAIVVPNNLGNNWQQDLHKMTGGKYNVVVLTSQVYNAWGADRVAAALRAAPVNTIVALSMNFLANVPRDASNILVVGTTPISIYPNVQLILENYDVDYIGIDESHFIKNPGTNLFKAVEALVAGPSVKTLRLASGTILTDRPTDLIGQVRLINPYVFRDARAFEAKYRSADGMSWNPGAAGAIRKRLSNFTTVFTAKKRDWAFLLPYPNEELHTVSMPLEYEELYEAIVKESLEDLKHGTPAQKKIYQYLIDGDESKAGEIEAALSKYIQRLEQFLVAPDADEMAIAAKKKLPPSPKIVDPNNGVISILDRHFAIKTSNPYSHKVLIFCRYINSAEAVYQALPPKYKAIAAVYHGSKKAALTDFEAFDKVTMQGKKDIRILCCVEQSINTGKNLQMASRIIRLQIPWSPGELDQASSRVMRPTPPVKGPDGKLLPHPLNRKEIWLDTIMMERSIEIRKFARLVSKIVTKVQFDEHGNSRYAKIPEVPMVKITMRERAEEELRTLFDLGAMDDGNADPGSYVDAFRSFKQAELDDFVEQKSTKLSEMVPVKSAPMMPGSLKLPEGLLPTIGADGRPIRPPVGSYKSIIDSALGKKPVKTKKVAPTVVEQPEVVKVTKKEVKRDPRQLHDNPDVEVNKEVYVYADTINGMYSVAIEATDGDITPRTAATFGMKPVGAAVVAKITSKKQLKDTLESLRAAKYSLRKKDVEIIEGYIDAFEGRKLNPVRATVKDTRNFFLEKRKPLLGAEDANKIRMYTVVRDGELWLMADLKSQRAAQRLARRQRLNGSTARWAIEEPSYYLFSTTKAQIIECLRKIETKFKVSNKPEVQAIIRKWRR